MSLTTLLRRRVDTGLAALHEAKAAVAREKTALAEVDARGDALKQALVIAQAVAQAVQEEAHAKITDLVSHCLSVVFDEPYTFKIKFEQKRGRTEASLVFERHGLEVDPLSASGGGVVDVASFALRLSCLLLARPPLRRLLVLDEPFRFLSAEHRPKVRELLVTLAAKMKVQIVMVTHSPELEAGTVIRLD